MSELPSPTRATAPLLQSTVRGHAHHTMHSILQHGQFGYKEDRLDLTNIPHFFKNIIVEQSAAKLKDYDPVKVCSRSDFKYSALDPKLLAVEKKKRVEDVYRCGFCSDPKELYRPLGEPILDTELLLYTRLDIDSTATYKKGNQRSDDFKDEPIYRIGTKNQLKFTDAPKRHTNGFRYIKEQVAKSNFAVNSVKFGVPFTSICDADTRIHTYDIQEAAPELRSSTKVDWDNLEIDLDRKGYFGNLLARHERSISAPNTNCANQGEKYTVKPQDDTTELQSNSGKKTRHVLLSFYEPDASLISSPYHPTDTQIQKPLHINMTQKQIESALDIKASNQTASTAEKFFTTRDHFYEQRQRLTHLLQDDLHRLEMERKTSFEKKVNAFELSKESNGQCIDDINLMRKKAIEAKRKEKMDIIAAHPWYNELIKKVVVMNGVRREVTQYESVLLSRLKRLVADKISFNKMVFVQLMKVIPTNEFIKDDIQRIIRFVKQHETTTERDYLEAVEMAGHSI
ncbi:hypothetical protein BASA83_002112 [Batrachochytrium salamandrivorans]|nr:hypothetical protein BASA62_005589 [Batrachochytrium salamandrivorans]KAH9275339.1 hypothetical protein BASA83_002112 [Batrachochytrium salamandrivorans]